MTVELRRIISQPPITGTIDDPIYVIVQGIAIIDFFAEDSVTAITPSPTVSTILTQLFSLGTFEKIVKARVSGTNYAKYYLKVNGVTLETVRTGPTLNETFDFAGAPYQLVIGDSVTLEVEHFNVGNIDCEASLYGYA